MYQPAHSDFLIHWTGKDIDITSSTADDLFLERLRSILKYGLWMTKDKIPEVINVNRIDIEKPLYARICFTELKLSESQDHANKYGPLGIGMKRYFLFDRLGSPMFYVQFGTRNLFFPPYSEWFVKSEEGQHLLNFFKHMCSKRPLQYDYYNESEWRIVYSEEIKERLLKNGAKEVTSLFNNPKDKDGPEYLIPLDPWLAMIIYPNLKVKKRSIEDKEIRGLLEEIANRKTITGCPERTHKPIELDLAACAHF